MEDISSKIETINYEAEQFRTAFNRYIGSIHAIDESLCLKLHQIVCEIDNFLDSRPKQIESPIKDQLTTTIVKKFGIRKTFVCNRCGDRVIGSTLNAVAEHIKSHEQPVKVAKKKESPANTSRKAKLENKTLPKKVSALFQGDFQNFFTEKLAVAKKLFNLPEYSEIETELLKLIRPAFPDKSVKIYYFGSRMAGIGTVHSDLDIYVDIGGVFNNFENRPSEETIKKLQIVQGLLAKNAKWTQLIAIQNARVPILKVLYKPKLMDCDIGFSNSLGFCKTNLMKYLLELQPIAKALAFFLKIWIERSKLNEHINTYSVVLLVVCYLQTKNLLPSIKTLQEGLEEPMIGPWLAVFTEKTLEELKIPKAPYMLQNFKKELILFFKYYTTFDFKHKLLCPYLGKVLGVTNLETSPLLPRYVSYIESEKDNKYAPLNVSLMNLQDPFQLNHNITKAVPLTVIQLLQQYFELSATALGASAEIPLDPSNSDHKALKAAVASTSAKDKPKK